MLKNFKTIIQSVFLIILLSSVVLSCRTAAGSSAEVYSPSADTESSLVENQDALERDSEISDNKFVFTSLKMERLLKTGIKYNDSSFYPVHRRGKIKYIEENLDKSGPSEIFILYTFASSSAEAEHSYLADKKNFVDESLREKYLAVIYTPLSERLVKKAVLPLKHRSELKDFSVVKISENTSIKAVKLSFSGEDGLSDNYITSSSSGKYYVFNMNSTLTEYNRIEDIDNDGFLEVLVYENLFEEGLGYETFITLYEYTEKGFISSGSVSVVRSLKAFLEETEKTLERKNISLFLNNSVPSAKLSALKNRGLDNKNIIRKIFYPVKKENEHFPDINVFMKNGSRIDFVFPEIVENPFRFDRTNIYNFTTYVRVSSESRDEAIYLVKIYMNSNPFKAPLFSFHVN